MPTVGYYSMSDGEGQAYQVDEVTNSGSTAVNVTIPNTAQLASLDTLYVVNPSNSAHGAEYNSNFSDISAAVNGGMNLIIFDRYVTDAQLILPGGSGITSVKDTSDGADVDVAAGAPSSFTNGPGGTIDDTTFDDGINSSHGYVELSTLPAGAVALLTTSDPTHIVAFTYPVGAGNVFYSTIPLDFYSNATHSSITPAEVDTLFTNTQASQTVCFNAGTLIESSQGPRLIERLRVGDLIPVEGGAVEPIRWIGATRIDKAQLARFPRLYPVRIMAGALGNGLPRRDLLVSRQHRMLVRSKIAKRMFGAPEVLVAAIKLTALPGIFVDESVAEVTYFHLLFDRHEVLFAEGAASESLYVGPQALKAIPPASRLELMALFPDLVNVRKSAETARQVPSPKAQKQLVARHLKNAKSLVENEECSVFG